MGGIGCGGRRWRVGCDWTGLAGERCVGDVLVETHRKPNWIGRAESLQLPEEGIGDSSEGTGLEYHREAPLPPPAPSQAVDQVRLLHGHTPGATPTSSTNSGRGPGPAPPWPHSGRHSHLQHHLGPWTRSGSSMATLLVPYQTLANLYKTL